MATGDGNERLYVLPEVFRAFAEVTTDYEALIATVAERMTCLVGDACYIVLLGDDGSWQVPGAVSACNPTAAELLRAAVARLPPSIGDTGLAQQVARTGEPVLIPQVDPVQLAEVAQPAFADAVTQLGIRSFLAVPLEVRERRLGALVLYRFLPDSPPFGDSDQAFARTIADHAALAITNAQLFESLQRELRERRRAEEEAKTFVALIENSTDFIAMAGFDGRVLFVNAAGRALVGLDPALDARTLTLADFHTEEGMERADIIRTKGSWQGEGVLRHFQTGELIPVQLASFLARDVDGRPLCFATVQRDLRETKRLEGELRQAQKMEALGRLAGGVAHDFNNLLTVIVSYCAMLDKSLPADSPARQDVGQIARAGQRATALTRQLLAFSRQQVLEPKALDLNATLRSMGSLIRPLIEEDLELVTTLGRDLGHVLVDAGQIEQVVMNLVVNARDAMRGGGVLSLETSRCELGDEAALALGLAPGAYNVLAVADTGTGIDEPTRAHLFEPFFTTKPKGKGTGLGLSTVMGIVKQSGGAVTVETAVGRGTTFRVYLPCTAAAVAHPAAKRVAAGALRGSERILLVEDEVQVRALIREVLVDAGYVVLEAVDGEQALQLSAATPDAIQLLLTDVIMPKMSGRQLARRFCAARPDARVLYMSGYADDNLGHHGVLDPGVELVQKPLTPELLLRRIREVLDA